MLKSVLLSLFLSFKRAIELLILEICSSYNYGMQNYAPVPPPPPYADMQVNF